MKPNQIAKALGRRGGLARAKRLSAEKRIKIASLGGQVKAISRKAAQRIQDNLIYADLLDELKKPPLIKVVSQVRHPLPGIYAKK